MGEGELRSHVYPRIGRRSLLDGVDDRDGAEGKVDKPVNKTLRDVSVILTFPVPLGKERAPNPIVCMHPGSTTLQSTP